MNESIEDKCNHLRADLLQKESEIRKLVTILKGSETIEGDKGECIAQAMLALRDCESSRMRLGKVIQYLNDGVSIYDK